ncbi:MmcQ/YjbR family DNA-binding protein [Aurantivibrio plasticivorans]
MTYDEFNQFCASLPQTTHVVQWGGSDVWKIGDKVFAIGGWEKSNKPAYSFKVSELNYNILEHEEGYRPAPYLASRGMKWIQKYDNHTKIDEELTYYLMQSYHIVSKGLTKKKQKELGLTPHVD